MISDKDLLCLVGRNRNRAFLMIPLFLQGLLIQIVRIIIFFICEFQFPVFDFAGSERDMICRQQTAQLRMIEEILFRSVNGTDFAEHGVNIFTIANFLSPVKMRIVQRFRCWFAVENSMFRIPGNKLFSSLVSGKHISHSKSSCFCR